LISYSTGKMTARLSCGTGYIIAKGVMDEEWLNAANAALDQYRSDPSVVREIQDSVSLIYLNIHVATRTRIHLTRIHVRRRHY
jgi:hypothetical protein